MIFSCAVRPFLFTYIQEHGISFPPSHVVGRLSPSIVASVGSRPPLSPCRTKHVHDRDEKSEEADDSHVNQHGVEIAVLRHPLRDSE